MRDFSQLYNIIYNKFLELPEKRKSEAEFRRFLGITNGKGDAWKRGQWPAADDLVNIAEKLGFSHGWLLTGKGSPFAGSPQSEPEQSVGSGVALMEHPIPLVGLASCGVQGMEQIMPFAMAMSPVRLSPRALAVVASGESMVPAGIGSGHICYCDPDEEPLLNEAVFLRQKDGLGALKLFLGRGERKGTTRFKGWLSPTETGERRDFAMDVADEIIDCIAPVILVRRRG